MLRKCSRISPFGKQLLNQLSDWRKIIGQQRRLFSFKANDLKVTLCSQTQKSPKSDEETLVFGHTFSDHMLQVNFNEKNGWNQPYIKPLENLQIHPGAKVLHYAIELFEGMKAYRGDDGKIRLFRPEKNMARMLEATERCCLPAFDGDDLLKCIIKLIEIDQDWVPRKPGSSLYIRPTHIGTEPTLGVQKSNESILFVITCPVGLYFKSGVKPVRLLADPMFCRAWPGGTGHRKMGSNYAPTLAVQRHAESLGCQQVLWLFGEDDYLTEVGTMNIFVHLVDDKGENELVTPPLSDNIILPGITRDSLLTLARDWNEFKVSERRITMKEILERSKKGQIIEIFGSGTACIVCPVSEINYKGIDISIPVQTKPESLSVRFCKELNDIYYGRKEFKNFTTIVC